MAFSPSSPRIEAAVATRMMGFAVPQEFLDRLASQALLEQARLPTWRIWARDAAIEKNDALKARGYTWSPGEFGRPKCW
jgi:DNA polymerase-3 subunit epsilon